MSTAAGTGFGRGWAYVGAVLGGVVSIAANVAHSYVPPTGAGTGWSPPTGAVIGAVFWPLALFVAIEILARTAWPAGRRWVVLRFLGLVPVAVVAAVVSYRHLSGLLGWYGEDPLTVTIGPLAVDGLMVMATGALVATSRSRTGQPTAGADATAPAAPATLATPAESTPNGTQDRRPVPAMSGNGAGDRAPVKPRPPRRAGAGKPDTATAVARMRARHPDMPATDIARRLGVTDRTVRRHLATRAAVPETRHDPDTATDPETTPEELAA